MPIRYTLRESFRLKWNDTRQYIKYISAIKSNYIHKRGFLGGAAVKNLPAKAGDSRDAGLIPGFRRYLGVGNGNSLQYSCLESSIDRGAYLVAKSWTQLSKWAHTHISEKNNNCVCMYTYIYTHKYKLQHKYVCV